MSKSIENKSELKRTLDLVTSAISIADRNGLTTEVVATALCYLNENPDTGIEYALHVALGDYGM